MDDTTAMAILSAIDLYARDYDYEYGLPHPLSQMIEIVKKAVTESAKNTEQQVQADSSTPNSLT